MIPNKRSRVRTKFVCDFKDRINKSMLYTIENEPTETEKQIMQKKNKRRVDQFQFSCSVMSDSL